MLPRKFTIFYKKKITIDTLVNNAGFATSGQFSEIELATEAEEIQVNVGAAARAHLEKFRLFRVNNDSADKVAALHIKD